VPKPEPALVVVEPDRRGLSLLGRFKCISLPPADDPIAVAEVSNTSPDIVYITDAGAVVVFSLARNRVLLRLAPGAST